MTTWTLVVVTAGGLTLLVTAPWLLARAGRRWGTDDVPMATLVRKPELQGFDAALRDRTAARRLRAETLRRGSARIDSGARDRARVIAFGDRQGAEDS